MLAIGEEGRAVAQRALDPARELPLVIVSYERDEGIARAEERGRELARRLAGIASVYVLGEGAVTDFSRTMYEALGVGLDVHSGAVRTYLPGLGSEDDFPGRHRFVAFPKLARRRMDLAALIIAPPLLLRAVETPPPPIWRSSARALLVGHPADGDYEELLEFVDGENAALSQEVADLREQIAGERDDNTEIQRRNDDLGRQLKFLRARLRVLEPAALAEEPEPDSFEPVLCSDVAAEARARLPMLEIPDSVDEAASELDEHGDLSWARREWSALLALNRYAEMKREREFDGSFLTYCERSAGEFVVPTSWVVPTESALTRETSRFRDLRTLPVSTLVDESGSVFMQEHIRIEKGEPRLLASTITTTRADPQGRSTSGGSAITSTVGQSRDPEAATRVS